MGVSIEGPSETPRTSEHYHIEGLIGGPQLDPIMPRHASLADSQCKFLQPSLYLHTAHLVSFGHQEAVSVFEIAVILVLHRLNIVKICKMPGMFLDFRTIGIVQ